MPSTSSTQTWFITGASTGFGKELAHQLLQAGQQVVATARKPEQIADFQVNFPELALVTQLDVTDAA